MSPTLLAIGMPGPFETLIIAMFGLLIFGKRLPEVGKGLARSIVEFKKGLREVTDEIENAGHPRPAAVAPVASVSSAPTIAPVAQAPVVAPTATPITPPATTPTP